MTPAEGLQLELPAQPGFRALPVPGELLGRHFKAFIKASATEMGMPGTSRCLARLQIKHLGRLAGWGCEGSMEMMGAYGSIRAEPCAGAGSHQRDGRELERRSIRIEESGTSSATPGCSKPLQPVLGHFQGWDSFSGLPTLAVPSSFLTSSRSGAACGSSALGGAGTGCCQSAETQNTTRSLQSPRERSQSHLPQGRQQELFSRSECASVQRCQPFPGWHRSPPAPAPGALGFWGFGEGQQRWERCRDR